MLRMNERERDCQDGCEVFQAGQACVAGAVLIMRPFARNRWFHRSQQGIVKTLIDSWDFLKEPLPFDDDHRSSAVS